MAVRLAALPKSVPLPELRAQIGQSHQNRKGSLHGKYKKQIHLYMKLPSVAVKMFIGLPVQIKFFLYFTSNLLKCDVTHCSHKTVSRIVRKCYWKNIWEMIVFRTRDFRSILNNASINIDCS